MNPKADVARSGTAMKPHVALACLAFFPSLAIAQPKASPLAWKKTVLDSNFRSEGVALADVNQDGKVDVIVGDVWYEAPSWKMHVIRADRTFDGAKGYSQSFAVFADDIDGDGFPDQIVVGFPGAPCHWYKNPGKAPNAKWVEYMINDNACNETPLYADVLGNGKRALVLGHQREMCYFTPGQDTTRPWERFSVSGKHSDPKKEMPGTNKFSHGLGVTDVDGDGKNDITCMDGWWKQPPLPGMSPWAFTPWSIPKCADMYAFDVDGDGKNEIIATSAHNTGFWWFQRGINGKLVQRDFFPIPANQVKPAGIVLAKEESELWNAVAKLRASEKKVPWRISPSLSVMARTGDTSEYKGVLHVNLSGSPDEVHKALGQQLSKYRHPGLELGIGLRKDGKLTLLLGDRGHFALPGQTHALHFVDLDGDGVKDFVTGRRFWAHGPGGDDHPGDPAFLFWFRGFKDSAGLWSYIPYQIDDDSGIGTQFAIGDIDGDGKPDIAISNKKGVFVFVQTPASKE
jgi:hypothetical protein